MHKNTCRFWVILGLAAWCVAVTRSAGLAEAASRQGCMNQWLFNGVWRVRVTAVEPSMNGGQQQGWQVTEVWRNGTAQELAPSDSVLTNQKLELQNGAITANETTGGTLSLQSVTFNNFPPAGEFTYKQVFVAPNLQADPSNKPQGLLITFNGAQLAQMKSKPQFSTSQYNFHFRLGCVATGAAANAEGGSNQLAARPGCLNEWMSNGVWKVRVTALDTYPVVLNKPQDQIGWLVTQTWVNASGRGIVPRGFCDQCPKFAGTGVTDEYLATQGGKSGSSANAVGGLKIYSKPGYDWHPGEAWTFQQFFSWGNFDPTDKPVRLLVTFDDKTQNATPGVPHYRKPADFRIDLTCSK
jgi:hypothetical protein